MSKTDKLPSFPDEEAAVTTAESAHAAALEALRALLPAYRELKRKIAAEEARGKKKGAAANLVTLREQLAVKEPPVLERQATAAATAAALEAARDKLRARQMAVFAKAKAEKLNAQLESNRAAFRESLADATSALAAQHAIADPVRVERLAEMQKLRQLLDEKLERVIDLFRRWDVDGNGLVDRAEFRRAVEIIAPKLGLAAEARPRRARAARAVATELEAAAGDGAQRRQARLRGGERG